MVFLVLQLITLTVTDWASVGLNESTGLHYWEIASLVIPFMLPGNLESCWGYTVFCLVFKA